MSVQPQVKPPFSRTDTKQSEAESGSYPPVEGFLMALGGHTQGVGRTNEAGSAADFLPEERSLSALKEAAAGCRGCRLWEIGTQTVFGEGAETSRLMLVGEQPGDQEDRAGRPFVGPAGRLLDQALEEAGIDRADTYVTNAVKHFKWQARGKRRIHQKPSWAETAASNPGSRPSSRSFSLRCSSCSARSPRSPCSAASSE